MSNRSSDLKYSIIIPTRNGIKYLPFAIQTILNQPATNFELIVSDNHSSDGTWEYLKSLQDNRVKIIQPEAPLSMVRHFDFILTQPNAEWVSILGDDDGLQPYFFDLADHLTEKFYEYEVICGKRSYFFWPGCEELYGKNVVNYSAFSITEIRNTNQRLSALLLGDEVYFDEPHFYTGTIFKKSLTDRIRKQQKGIVLNSIAPDANGVALVLKYCKKYIYSGVPIGWIGSSPKSTGFSASSDDINTTDRAADSKNDFVTLNSNDNLTLNPKFKTAMELFDPRIFFLEALAQSETLYSIFYVRFLRTYFMNYAVFANIYGISVDRIRIRHDLSKSYTELFAAHKLWTPLLKWVYFIQRFKKKIYYAIKGRMLRSDLATAESRTLVSESHLEYPTILNANKVTIKFYKDLKNHI